MRCAQAMHCTDMDREVRVMGKHDALSKTLAVAGTVLVALPLIAPLVFSVRFLGRPGGFRIDYLMPFEIYPVTLVGVALLIWVAFRARERKREVGWAVGGMFAGILLAAAAAKITGIADSVERLETWRYALTAALGGLSLLAQVALVVIGWLLARGVFAAHDNVAPPGVMPNA